MPSIHRDREPTYEPVDVEVATPTGPGLTDDPPASPDDPTPGPPRRRTRGPRRPAVRAEAGHATATGKASGA